MKRKTVQGVKTEPMFPQIEVRALCKRGDGGEECRGKDGRLVYPGVIVRCPPFYHEGLRTTVVERWGRVKRLYRQDGIKNPKSSCDITVQTHDGRYFWLDQVKRSSRTLAMNGEEL